MSDGSKDKYLETVLDPALLSKPFSIQTSWHVITGASCSGKSTLIDQLAERGFKTLPEAARLYFEREFAKGHTIEELRQDTAAMTLTIWGLWLEMISELNPADTIFHDRGLPDAPAFFRLAGMDPNDAVPECLRYRYISVFVLDRLPYQKDDVRAGDDQIAEYFESWLLRDYNALGYEIIKVPVLPREERLEFILKTLNDQGHTLEIQEQR
jgi:predicted ATPase